MYPSNWLRDLGDNGPDAFLELRFARAASGPIASLVRALAPAGFEHHRLRGPDLAMRCQFRPPLSVASLDLYIDPINAGAFLDLYRGRPGRGLWYVYEVILVGGGRVWFENGNACVHPICRPGQMDLLDAVAARPDLRLESWAIEYGGQGYTHGVVRSGRSARSLRDYALS